MQFRGLFPVACLAAILEACAPLAARALGCNGISEEWGPFSVHQHEASGAAHTSDLLPNSVAATKKKNAVSSATISTPVAFDTTDALCSTAHDGELQTTTARQRLQNVPVIGTSEHEYRPSYIVQSQGFSATGEQTLAETSASQVSILGTQALGLETYGQLPCFQGTSRKEAYLFDGLRSSCPATSKQLLIRDSTRGALLRANTPMLVAPANGYQQFIHHSVRAQANAAESPPEAKQIIFRGSPFAGQARLRRYIVRRPGTLNALRRLKTSSSGLPAGSQGSERAEAEEQEVQRRRFNAAGKQEVAGCRTAGETEASATSASASLSTDEKLVSQASLTVGATAYVRAQSGSTAREEDAIADESTGELGDECKVSGSRSCAAEDKKVSSFLPSRESNEYSSVRGPVKVSGEHQGGRLLHGIGKGAYNTLETDVLSRRDKEAAGDCSTRTSNVHNLHTPLLAAVEELNVNPVPGWRAEHRHLPAVRRSAAGEQPVGYRSAARGAEACDTVQPHFLAVSAHASTAGSTPVTAYAGQSLRSSTSREQAFTERFPSARTHTHQVQLPFRTATPKQWHSTEVSVTGCAHMQRPSAAEAGRTLFQNSAAETAQADGVSRLAAAGLPEQGYSHASTQVRPSAPAGPQKLSSASVQSYCFQTGAQRGADADGVPRYESPVEAALPLTTAIPESGADAHKRSPQAFGAPDEHFPNQTAGTRGDGTYARPVSALTATEGQATSKASCGARAAAYDVDPASVDARIGAHAEQYYTRYGRPANATQIPLSLRTEFERQRVGHCSAGENPCVYCRSSQSWDVGGKRDDVRAPGAAISEIYRHSFPVAAHNLASKEQHAFSSPQQGSFSREARVLAQDPWRRRMAVHLCRHTCGSSSAEQWMRACCAGRVHGGRIIACVCDAPEAVTRPHVLVNIFTRLKQQRGNHPFERRIAEEQQQSGHGSANGRLHGSRTQKHTTRMSEQQVNERFFEKHREGADDSPPPASSAPGAPDVAPNLTPQGTDASTVMWPISAIAAERAGIQDPARIGGGAYNAHRLLFQVSSPPVCLRVTQLRANAHDPSRPGWAAAEQQQAAEAIWGEGANGCGDTIRRSRAPEQPAVTLELQRHGPGSVSVPLSFFIPTATQAPTRIVIKTGSNADDIMKPMMTPPPRPSQSPDGRIAGADEDTQSTHNTAGGQTAALGKKSRKPHAFAPPVSKSTATPPLAGPEDSCVHEAERYSILRPIWTPTKQQKCVHSYASGESSLYSQPGQFWPVSGKQARRRNLRSKAVGGNAKWLPVSSTTGILGSVEARRRGRAHPHDLFLTSSTTAQDETPAEDPRTQGGDADEVLSYDWTRPRQQLITQNFARERTGVHDIRRTPDQAIHELNGAHGARCRRVEEHAIQFASWADANVKTPAQASGSGGADAYAIPPPIWTALQNKAFVHPSVKKRSLGYLKPSQQCAVGGQQTSKQSHKKEGGRPYDIVRLASPATRRQAGAPSSLGQAGACVTGSSRATEDAILTKESFGARTQTRRLSTRKRGADAYDVPRPIWAVPKQQDIVHASAREDSDVYHEEDQARRRKHNVETPVYDIPRPAPTPTGENSMVHDATKARSHASDVRLPGLVATEKHAHGQTSRRIVESIYDVPRTFRPDQTRRQKQKVGITEVYDIPRPVSTPVGENPMVHDSTRARSHASDVRLPGLVATEKRAQGQTSRRIVESVYDFPRTLRPDQTRRQKQKAGITEVYDIPRPVSTPVGENPMVHDSTRARSHASDVRLPGLVATEKRAPGQTSRRIVESVYDFPPTLRPDQTRRRKQEVGITEVYDIPRPESTAVGENPMLHDSKRARSHASDVRLPGLVATEKRAQGQTSRRIVESVCDVPRPLRPDQTRWRKQEVGITEVYDIPRPVSTPVGENPMVHDSTRARSHASDVRLPGLVATEKRAQGQTSRRIVESVYDFPRTLRPDQTRRRKQEVGLTEVYDIPRPVSSPAGENPMVHDSTRARSHASDVHLPGLVATEKRAQGQTSRRIVESVYDVPRPLRPDQTRWRKQEVGITEVYDIPRPVSTPVGENPMVHDSTRARSHASDVRLPGLVATEKRAQGQTSRRIVESVYDFPRTLRPDQTRRRKQEVGLTEVYDIPRPVSTPAGENPVVHDSTRARSHASDVHLPGLAPTGKPADGQTSRRIVESVYDVPRSLWPDVERQQRVHGSDRIPTDAYGQERGATTAAHGQAQAYIVGSSRANKNESSKKEPSGARTQIGRLNTLKRGADGYDVPRPIRVEQKQHDIVHASAREDSDVYHEKERARRRIHTMESTVYSIPRLAPTPAGVTPMVHNSTRARSHAYDVRSPGLVATGEHAHGQTPRRTLASVYEILRPFKSYVKQQERVQRSYRMPTDAHGEELETTTATEGQAGAYVTGSIRAKEDAISTKGSPRERTQTPQLNTLNRGADGYDVPRSIWVEQKQHDPVHASAREDSDVYHEKEHARRRIHTVETTVYDISRPAPTPAGETPMVHDSSRARSFANDVPVQAFVATGEQAHGETSWRTLIDRYDVPRHFWPHVEQPESGTSTVQQGTAAENSLEHKQQLPLWKRRSATERPWMRSVIRACVLGQIGNDRFCKRTGFVHQCMQMLDQFSEDYTLETNQFSLLIYTVNSGGEDVTVSIPFFQNSVLAFLAQLDYSLAKVCKYPVGTEKLVELFFEDAFASTSEGNELWSFGRVYANIGRRATWKVVGFPEFTQLHDVAMKVTTMCVKAGAFIYAHPKFASSLDVACQSRQICRSILGRMTQNLLGRLSSSSENSSENSRLADTFRYTLLALFKGHHKRLAKRGGLALSAWLTQSTEAIFSHSEAGEKEERKR